MSRKIVINPVTRISGFMEIQADVENNIVVDARTEGLFFRGFEKMLKGRSPFDAVFFTQRICGICSTAHSIASTLALEDALGVVPNEQGRYLRDFIHGCEFLQNHLRHFYQYTLPDFVRLPEGYPLFKPDHKDFRLPSDKNAKLVKSYFDSLDISRSAHEMLSVFGGKAPHNHGVFVGGTASQATTDKIIKARSVLEAINQFVCGRMLPDVYTIAEYYRDYFTIGRGYGNLLSYGCFDQYKDLGTLYVDPLVYSNNSIRPFNAANITEEIKFSYYSGSHNTYKPMEGEPSDNMNKPDAYSWVKASRYMGLPFESGPLSRQWLSGGYRNGISTMDRTIARVLEAKKVTEILKTLLDNIYPSPSGQEKFDIPNSASGEGLIDTTRGALGHWLRIENHVIDFYQVITPSGWNLSTRSNNNMKGTAEQAIMGITIKDTESPVEIGRTIRSFDPCVSCATHVYTGGKHISTLQVVP